MGDFDLKCFDALPACLISVAHCDASSAECALRSETVIADLPFESRVDRISVFLLGCLKVAPGTTPDLGCKQSAFGFHHERAKRFGTKRKGSLCANFFTNSRLIPFMRIIPIYAAFWDRIIMTVAFRCTV